MFNLISLILAVTLLPSGGDDTARIQNALTSSEYVELMGGQFNTTATLNINGDRTLRCLERASISATVVGNPAIQVNSGLGITTLNVRIEGCTFDGNNVTPVGVRWGQTTMPTQTGTGSMRDVYLKRFTSAAVRGVVTVGLHLIRVTAKQNTGDGLHLTADSINGNVATVVEGCWFAANQRGMFVEGAMALTVRESIFETSTQEGVLVRRPDNESVTTRSMFFVGNHFENNNSGRVGGPHYQFRADTLGDSILQMLTLERNNFCCAGGSNGHVYLGKGRFREIDNEYLSPIAGAVTCTNSTVSFIMSRSDQAPANFWTVPGTLPPIVWVNAGNGVYDIYKNVLGAPVKQ